MALHPKFPDAPHAILDPAIRWLPADEALRTTSFEKLLPPLVPTLQKEVQAWRESGYDGATGTSKSLLRWWFSEQHFLDRPGADASGSPMQEFQYFFSQREAQGFMVPKLSVFNRIIGDSSFELEFAAFLESCQGEIVSYAKNYFAVGFKLDYVNADGNISNYYPDFFVKVSAREVMIVETKGQEDLDVPLKMARLKQWCEDITRAQNAARYDFVFVDEEGFKKYRPHSFAGLVSAFQEYKT